VARIPPSLLCFCTAVLIVAAAGRVSAQPMTRCAACHFANVQDVPAPDYLADWQHSAHARHVVGCHECHGGDPWTYVPADAHRGVLGPTRASSPVAAANLVRTCARCHQAVTQAFAGTLHQTLARTGEWRAPDCTTCHGAMSATVPSPAALEARCADCHRPGSVRAEYPALMRGGIEELNALRARADALDDAIARVPEHSRRVELLVAMYNTRQSLKECLARVHAFNVQQLNVAVDAARRQLDDLARASAAAAAATADR
jgi:hypothetical protein